MALSINDIDSTMDIVMKNIYSSCDILNTNLVPTSKLIDFIMPYMLEDLSALESLKSSLDPKNEDVSVSSEKFYEVMNEWAQKIASSNEDEEDFIRTPSQLDTIDDKRLPYTQSTPRASFGQKLLRCEGLLNLSNESFYNISASIETKDNSTVGAEKEKTMLEEQVKRLEHQLNKVGGEMEMVKIQLALTEEQNEQLQSDLERCRTRLSSEQQVNDHLQKSKSYVDELKEEIRFGKRRIEELNKKLTQYEKDNIHMSSYIQKLEKENNEFEERLEHMTRREKEWRKDLFDMKTELDMKDHEIMSLTNLNEDLKLKLSENKNLVDQLMNENELLDYKKQGLEKVLSSRRYSSGTQYKTCLEELSGFVNKGTLPIYSPTFNESQWSCSYNSPTFLKKILSPISPNLGSPIYPLTSKDELLRKALKCSTPNPKLSNRSVGRLSTKKSYSLNNLNLSTQSLPDIHCSERSNVVQDQSYEEEAPFETQLVDFRRAPQPSLQAELFQVERNEDSKNGADHVDFGAKINHEESLYEKLNQLKATNDRLQTELSTAEERATELEIKLSHVMFDQHNIEESLKVAKKRKDDLEKEMETLKVYKVEQAKNDDRDKIIVDLEEKLDHLKREFEALQSAYARREGELDKYKNKFNFESAYKAIQIELTERNKELSSLRHTNNEYKELICKLTNSNQELEKSLKHAKTVENIEETANRVQAHIDTKKSVLTELQELNKTFQSNVKKLEDDLRDKIKEISQLKDILKCNEDIKKTMWRDNKKLENELVDLRQGNEQLFKQLEESKSSKESLQDEFNSLLAKYDDEVVKNGDLSCQISKQQQELSRLQGQVTALKDEFELVKNSNKNENEQLFKQLEESKSSKESLQDEFISLLARYDDEVVKNGDLNCQISKQQHELSRLQGQVTALKNEIEFVKNSNKNENEQLLKQLKESKSSKERLQDEFNSLLTRYDDEVVKNSDLNCQISKQQQEISRLLEQLTVLKNEVEVIKNTNKDEKEKMNHKLRNYEKLLQDHEEKNKDLGSVNEQLKMELEAERKLKEDSVPDELFNSLQGFQVRLHNLETKINDLETRNELLKSELEYERKKSRQEADNSSDCSSLLSFSFDKVSSMEPKNRSFEKQKLTIDRLKERLENLEGHLAKEKSKCDALRKILHDKEDVEDKLKKLEVEYREADQGNALEKRRLQIVIDQLTDKLRCQEEYYKQIYGTSKEKVEELSLRLAELDECNRSLRLQLAEKESLLSTSSEVNERNKHLIENLNKKLLEMEEEKSKVFLELTEKENAHDSLLFEYKTFQEKFSKTDDHKEKELMDTEERIRNSRFVLESLDAELEASKEQVNKSRSEMNDVSERMFGLINVVHECTDDLSRAFSQVAEKWENVFGGDLRFKKLPPMKACHTLEVEEGILVLNDNIKVTVSLLEILSSKAPTSMDDSESQIHDLQQSNCDSKTVKKFTLRPPRLLLNRPVSPDSPSLEIDVPPVEPPNQETDKNTVNEGCHIFSTTTDTVTENYSNTHLPILPLDLPFQDAFPHVTDNFLEKLGLHASSPKQKLSKDETEKLFTTFAIQIALDSRDIKERLHKQKQQCVQQHKKCFYLIKDISMRLRDHRCIGATDPINPVFVLLEDVRFLLQEIIQSAGQLGILTCENRMMKCWNLVTNYMAIVKQNAAKQKQVLPNRSQDEKLSKMINFREENSKQVTEKSDFKQKPKEPPSKANAIKVKRDQNKSCFANFTIAMIWAFFFSFLFLVLLISIHWQCKMITDHQVCPLDDFIQKIRVGTPPY